MTLDYLTLQQATNLLEQKKISSVELTHHYLHNIDQKNQDLGAYLAVSADNALDQAKQSDQRRAQSKTLGALDGVPCALKDVITTKGTVTTAASKMLENFKPAYNAHVTELLSQAGSIMLGKTNLDEFAMGTTTEYSAYTITKNPKDTTRVAGGSSGGSAAAVAADLSLFALGTDTGGSIRLPAAWTGVVGLRPTYGRVSRRGVIAMASSLDQVGTFTRSVSDAAYILSVIAEPDQLDSTSVKRNVPLYAKHLEQDLKGMKIGLVKEFIDQGVDKHIKQAVLKAVEDLRHLGAHVEEVSLPLSKLALAVYCIIVPAEVSTNLERYDGIKYGYSALSDAAEQSLLDVYMQSRSAFGSEAKRRIMLGTYVLSAGYYDAYYTQAQKVRALIFAEFQNLFKQFDVLIGPVSPAMPPKIGENTENPLQRWMADLLTVPVNIAGLPGMSVPCGEFEGLPIGLQIMANQFEEEKIFRVASSFEVLRPWQHLYHTKE